MEDFDVCLVLNPLFGKAPGPAQAAALTTHAQVRQREGVDTIWDLIWMQKCTFFHISLYKLWYVQTKADCADTNLSLSVEGVPCKRQEAGGFEGDLNLAGNEHIRLKT